VTKFEFEYRLENCPKCGEFGKTVYITNLPLQDWQPGDTFDLMKRTIVCHEPVE
jgi:hypothetical protein